jgi:hypothetical protein
MIDDTYHRRLIIHPRCAREEGHCDPYLRRPLKLPALFSPTRTSHTRTRVLRTWKFVFRLRTSESDARTINDHDFDVAAPRLAAHLDTVLAGQLHQNGGGTADVITVDH